MKKEIEIPSSLGMDVVEEYVLKKKKEIKERGIDAEIEIDYGYEMKGGSGETTPYRYVKGMLDRIFKLEKSISDDDSNEETIEESTSRREGVFGYFKRFVSPVAEPTAEPAAEPAAEPTAEPEEEPAAEPKIDNDAIEIPEENIKRPKLIITSNEEIIPFDEILKKRKEREQRIDETIERYKYEEIPKIEEMGKTYMIGSKIINIGFEENEIKVEKSQYEGTKKWYTTI